MATSTSGKPKPVIVPSAPAASSSSSIPAPSPPTIDRPGPSSRSRRTFGGDGSSSSLTIPARGASSASLAMNSADIGTPELAGWSWTTTGMPIASVTVEVVAAHGCLGGAGKRRRGEHDRVRPGSFRLTREGDGAIRRGVRDADAHGEAAVRGGEDALDDRGAFRITELRRLAQDAEDGHARDAVATTNSARVVSDGSSSDAVLAERRGDDVPDAADGALGAHRVLRAAALVASRSAIANAPYRPRS